MAWCQLCHQESTSCSFTGGVLCPGWLSTQTNSGNYFGRSWWLEMHTGGYLQSTTAFCSAQNSSGCLQFEYNSEFSENQTYLTVQLLRSQRINNVIAETRLPYIFEHEWRTIKIPISISVDFNVKFVASGALVLGNKVAIDNIVYTPTPCSFPSSITY
jgi:hypothetical protein